MDLHEVRKYLRTSGVEEVRQLIVHCEQQLDNPDEDIRLAARAALKIAREDLAIRKLVASVRREADGGP